MLSVKNIPVHSSVIARIAFNPKKKELLLNRSTSKHVYMVIRRHVVKCNSIYITIRYSSVHQLEYLDFWIRSE